MQLALHHPEEGYYSTAIENIGMRGDFSTTPTLSPILAKAIIARWKEACARCGTRLPLLEIGAGSGALAVKIMDQLGFWNRLNTDYVIVEASPRLPGVPAPFAGQPGKNLFRHGKSPEALRRKGLYFFQ